VVIIFSILDSILKCNCKKLVIQLFHLFRTNTNPDRPDPDRHALDAVPDPDPAKKNEADPTNTVILGCWFLL